jgi:cell division protein FtsW (lipid II flippase)
MEQALATEKGSVSQTFQDLVSHPILWISIQTRAAIILGIIFLKIAKPDLGWSLLTIGVATVLGLASALPVLRLARMFVTFFVSAFVAALVLFAANSIPAGTISLSKSASDVQGVQTKRSEIPAEVGSSNLSTQAPTPSSEMALQEGPLLLQTRCTQCHPLQKILQVKKTRTEWEETLTKMESLNVKINDTEKKVLLDFLTTVDNP